MLSAFCTGHGWVSWGVEIICSHLDWSPRRNQSSAFSQSSAGFRMSVELQEWVCHRTPSSLEPSLRSLLCDSQILRALLRGFCDFWGKTKGFWCCGWRFLRLVSAVRMRKERIFGSMVVWRSREVILSCGFARFCVGQRYCRAKVRGIIDRRGRIACLKYNYFWSMKLTLIINISHIVINTAFIYSYNN